MNPQFLKLFVAGFVSFFATGLDDTIAYSSIMKSRREKVIVSSGIITATIIDIFIAIFLGGLLSELPNPHIIAGIGMIGLGAWVWSGKGMEPKPPFKLLTRYPEKYSAEKIVSAPKLFFRGFISFFLTGIDDTIAYSFLMTTPVAIAGLSTGILVATVVNLVLIFFLAQRLKGFQYTKQVGGSLLMLLGLSLLVGLF